jgi:hypothetical protein
VEKEKQLDQKKDELDKRENQLREKTMDRSIFSGKFYYLKIKEYLEEGHYNNEMVMIDPVSRKVLFKSP